MGSLAILREGVISDEPPHGSLADQGSGGGDVCARGGTDKPQPAGAYGGGTLSLFG